MAAETMKALAVTVVGEKAELIDAPVPEADADGVVVKTHFSGVSAGTEMWVATGRRDPKPTPFLNPGYQVTGEIVEAGADVSDFAAGDLVAVFCKHAHSQFVKASAGLTHKLPDPSIAKIASLFVQPSVGGNALNHADVRCGDVVLITGQGLVGQATAQLARLRGAYVITSEVSPERIAISQQHCADEVIDASRGKVSEQLKERFPWGVDVVIESTGFQQLLEDAMECVRAGGRFVFEGWYPDTITYTFHIPHAKQVRAFYPSFIGEGPNREGVLRLMASGKLDIEPLISHHVPWQECADTYNCLFTEKRDRFNGIVFDWRS